jgi:hypothetical protein
MTSTPDVVNIYRSIKMTTMSSPTSDALEAIYLPLSKEDRKKYYFEVRYQHAYDYESWIQHLRQQHYTFDEDWVQWYLPTQQEYQRKVWNSCWIVESKG